MTIGQNRKKLVCHFLVVSLIVLGIDGKKFRFHLPWACSVLNGKGDLVGTCTIFDRNKVLVSADNFNETEPGSDPPKTFYQTAYDGDIYVHAGSNYMNVDLVTPKLKYAQKIRASRLTVLFKFPNVRHPSQEWEFHHNPTVVSPSTGAEFDVFGLAFNVAILLLHEQFDWNPYVQPMLIRGPNLAADTRQYTNILESLEIQSDTCVTYSWSHTQNKIRYHEVMLLTKDNCLTVFCSWKLSRCREFPTKGYLVCFKSTKFADVCPSARGAALYCPKFANSVFAILTTAPSCGLQNMPGVYTTLPKAVELWERTFNLKFDYERRPMYDLYSLQQRNDDYDGIP